MALQNHHPAHKHTYTQLGEERNEKHLTTDQIWFTIWQFNKIHTPKRNNNKLKKTLHFIISFFGEQ